MDSLPLSLLLFLISGSLLSVLSFPARNTIFYETTVTVIRKPSCFILPSSTVLPSCDSQRKRRWLQIEYVPDVWPDWMQFQTPSVEEIEDDSESENYDESPPPKVESSLTESFRTSNIPFPNIWNGYSDQGFLNAMVIKSTVTIVRTLATQRLVPDCLDPVEVYEPACPEKPMKIEWGYHGLHSPEQWKEIDVTCASGEEESPIEINFNETIPANFPELELSGYDVHPTEYSVENNGHTLVVFPKNSQPPEARKGGLRSDYVFGQMHFHWGETSEVGSEHVIDGKRYPMEIHMVHYNKNYGSVEKSIPHRDGLEVLAIFVKISKSANPVFDELVAAADELVEPSSKKLVPGTSFTLKQFLPTSGGFYRYHGSLTTPNCNQAVYWTVFAEPITISEEQIAAFRKLRDHDQDLLAGNYRPVQKLFGREVFRSF